MTMEQRRHSFLHQSMTGYSYPAIGKPGLYIRSTDMQLSGIHTFAEKITFSGTISSLKID
jgi:hypothetical protein